MQNEQQHSLTGARERRRRWQCPCPCRAQRCETPPTTATPAINDRIRNETVSLIVPRKMSAASARNRRTGTTSTTGTSAVEAEMDKQKFCGTDRKKPETNELEGGRSGTVSCCDSLGKRHVHCGGLDTSIDKEANKKRRVQRTGVSAPLNPSASLTIQRLRRMVLTPRELR
jgi:hypothetical protein